MAEVEIYPAGDSAVMVDLGGSPSVERSARVRAIRDAVESAGLRGVTEVSCAYCSLMVSYDPLVCGCRGVRDGVRRAVEGAGPSAAGPGRAFDVPVLYGGGCGPDLGHVAAVTGLAPDEVVDVHAAGSYYVGMVGFLPGFAYLGGMDGRIACPRLAEPRPTIPAGSVGIAASQTGVYPIESPGGWQIVGRTPLRPYDPRFPASPALFSAGDAVRFVPVDDREFEAIASDVERGRRTWASS